jgi:hypothetical protein
MPLDFEKKLSSCPWLLNQTAVYLSKLSRQIKRGAQPQTAHRERDGLREAGGGGEAGERERERDDRRGERERL